MSTYDRDALLQSAEAGEAEAMEKLAYMLRWGVKGPVDEAGAYRWYRAAAEAGLVKGMEGLAECLASGTGVEEDLRGAVRARMQATQAGSRRSADLLRRWVDHWQMAEPCAAEGLTRAWLDQHFDPPPPPVLFEPEPSVAELGLAAISDDPARFRAALAGASDINGLGHDQATALHKAAAHDKRAVVMRLLVAGADTEVLDRNRLTPLSVACSNGHEGIALELLFAGAAADATRVSDGMTPLKFAAGRCSAKLIHALIDKGAAPDGPEGTSQTALMLAARAGNVAAIEALLARGADPARPCGLPWAEGWTALQLAENEGRARAAAALRAVTPG